MSDLVILLLAALCIALGGCYAGCETGLYSLSRARLEVEARHGGRSARVMLALVRRDAWVLITTLIGTTLALELATWLLEHQLHKWGFSSAGRQALLALGLTPFAFYFGEALPKELFRRHPHRLMGGSSPFVLVSLAVFAPLVCLLRGMTHLVERLTGVVGERAGTGPPRASLISVLDEGAGSGEITRHAVDLARNALSLQSIPVSRAMVPWDEVQWLDLGRPEADQRRTVESSTHTRLPICADGVVRGYLHQLDVLAERPAGPVSAHLRSVPHLEPDSSVHKALLRLRMTGGRLAVVGPPEAPLGLVTLKDLLEEISGDLSDW